MNEEDIEQQYIIAKKKFKKHLIIFLSFITIDAVVFIPISVCVNVFVWILVVILIKGLVIYIGINYDSYKKKKKYLYHTKKTNNSKDQK